jgi:hypothetical protein
MTRLHHTDALARTEDALTPGAATVGKADRLAGHDLPAQALSLRFNHEGFCDGSYVHRKTPPSPSSRALRRPF